MKGRWILAMTLAGLVLPVGAASPDHLVWAQRLVADLRPEDNSYGSRPTLVEWRGVDGASRSRNRSVCSTFITALFERAYGYGPDERLRWLGLRSPWAVDYYRAIAAGHRFRQVATVRSMAPGDLLASRQLNRTSTVTGHLMLAAARPQALGPCVADRCVYRLEVIDSSRSGHGPNDTRQGGGGVGRGTIQLQADRQGRVQAYRWSEQAGSRWRGAAQEPLIIGRFCGETCRYGSDQLRGMINSLVINKATRAEAIISNIHGNTLRAPSRTASLA